MSKRSNNNKPGSTPKSEVDETNVKSGSKTQSSGRGSRRPNPKSESVNDGTKWVHRPNVSGVNASDCNDVAWYAHSPEMLKAAASINFTNVAGVLIPSVNKGDAVPGILAINWDPTVGDPRVFQLAADNIYSYIRHANSGAKNYDPADLMMYLLAADQIFSAIGMLTRAYGFMRTYAQQNKYLAKALITAMGFDYDDLLKNLSSMWFDINELIVRSRTIWVPGDLTFIARHYWMNQNVYTDGVDPKSQLYIYVQSTFWKFSADDPDVGSELVPEKWMSINFNTISTATNQPITIPGGLKTWAQAKSFVGSLITAIDIIGDGGIMAGDMLKAYGAANIYSLQPITSDYMLQPVKNDEVLTQIHNATAAVVPTQGVTQTATGIQLTNYEKSVPPEPFQILPKTVTLDFYGGQDPTPEMVMVATRLTQAAASITKVTVGSATTYTWIATNEGTERVQAFTMYWFDYYNASATTTKVVPDLVYTRFTTSSLMNGSTPSGAALNMMSPTRLLAQYSKFDWAPNIYLGAFNTATGQIHNYDDAQVYWLYGDLENYTDLASNTLNKMHTTAVLSEFGVPFI